MRFVIGGTTITDGGGALGDISDTISIELESITGNPNSMTWAVYAVGSSPTINELQSGSGTNLVKNFSGGDITISRSGSTHTTMSPTISTGTLMSTAYEVYVFVSIGGSDPATNLNSPVKKIVVTSS